MHMLFTVGSSFAVFCDGMSLIRILCLVMCTTLWERCSLFWGYPYETLRRKNYNQNAHLGGKRTMQQLKS